MIYNNPAARLHRILIEIKKEDPNTGTLSAWSKALGCGKDFTSLLNEMAKVYSLPKQVRDAVRNTESVDNELFLSWETGIQEAFLNLRWDGQIHLFHNNIPDTLLIPLQFVADALNRLSPEKTLDPEKLDAMLGEAWDLYHKIETSDVDRSVKEYLSSHLMKIINALNDYDLLGVTPLQTAIDSSIGSIATNKIIAQTSHESETGKSFWKFAGKIGLILNITQAFVQLGGTAVDLIEDVDTPPTDPVEQNDANSDKKEEPVAN